MSDDLVVSGGGRITVATEELLVAVDRCRVLASRLDDVASELIAVAPADVPEVAPLRGVTHRTASLADRLRTAGTLLGVALDAYSLVERTVSDTAEVAARRLAYAAGFVGPAALALVPTPILLLLGSWLAGGVPGLSRADLSDPRTVSLLRLLAGSVDDAARGAAHLPLPLSELGDDRATGLLGRRQLLQGALGALLAAGAVVPGSLRVQPVSREAVPPPRSLAELAARVPPPEQRGPQIRIERYDGVSAVYLSGTVDLGLGPSEEPWDLASNLQALAGTPADSVEAAAAALREAGIGPDDPVVLVGYSQGGLVASRLAGSGLVTAVGMVTLGSPGGAVPVAAGVPALALEHREDLVPALSGGRTEVRERVTVTRSLYDGRKPDSPLAVPAHDLAEYRRTAALTDRSEESRVSSTRDVLLARFHDVGAGEGTDWRADRVVPENAEAERGGPRSAAR